MKTLALVIAVNTGYIVNMKCKLLCTTLASVGHFCALVWYSQILCYPRVGHLPTLGATPGLFTSTGLLTRNPNVKPHMEKFIEKASRSARLSRTRKTCRGFNFLFLDFMAIFLKLLIKRINLLMND